jgi:GAF domain-containing protein/HAMP domain-containing protein
MNTSNSLQFNVLDFEDLAVPEGQRGLYNVLAGAISYIPLMLGFNALGFLLIYVLANIGFLDAADPKLLIVAAISLIAGILHLPIAALFKQNKIEAVLFSLFILDGLASASQVFLWEGAVPLVFFILSAVSPALVFLPLSGIKPRTKLGILGIAALLVVAILVLSNSLGYERLQNENLSTMAGLTIYVTVIFIMVALVVTNAISFRTISMRLIVTFAFLVFVSAASTLVVSALVNLFRDRTQTFEQLRTISELQAGQMFAILQDYEQNATQASLGDDAVLRRIYYLLEEDPNSFVYGLNYELVNDVITKTIAQSPDYVEIFLFDNTGKVIISTNKINENQVIAGQRVFAAAARGQKFSIENNPFGGQETATIITRIERNNRFIGAFATQVQLRRVGSIFETQTGLGETLESYLVGSDYIAITATRAGDNINVQTPATTSVFAQKLSSGSDIYPNYNDVQVLGYYQYLPDLDVMLVSEIEQGEVVQKILQLLYTNIAVGAFTALLTLAIVLVISRSISTPIVNLAKKATSLAQGDLSARINIYQQDEIGSLANTFNTLGSELQSLIQTLEQKVADRTEDLQKQANRLRVAAEVARDATTSQDLDELLTRSAQLVMDRFGFYHTGVFLIDPQREYAVLRASPTEAGQEMLRRQHRLRIGEVGIVGYAAATGEPRIALDTGLDVAYFNNPLLPNTRSEMALPLVVNNQIIGVLDVQSEQAEAFTQEDIATLQIMADQLALAIQKAQFSEELQRNLQELEYAYQRFTLSSWSQLVEEREKRLGYTYDGLQISPVSEPGKESVQAVQQGKSILKTSPGGANSAAKSILAIPVKVREQTIGVINLNFASKDLSQETLRLAEDISNRLAMSLENARLYSETQRLAESERLAGEIATRIGSSINIETILRTTVEEIGRLAPGAEITVQISKDKDN